MAFIDSTVVNVALPAIQASFHATVVGVQWVVESYGLFLAALILAGGSLGDLYGRRLVFLVGVALFAMASLSCGLASNIDYLIVARSIQGVGAALLVPGSLAIISVSFDEKSRGKAIGTWSGFTAITTAIGPVLGGWLVEHASWRWAFFINVPLAAMVLAIAVWSIPESRSTSGGHIDWLGTFFAVVGLGALVGALIESATLGWRNVLVWGSLIAGVGCLIAFCVVEARVKWPMVPLTMLKSRSFSGANLLTLFLYSAIGIFFFFAASGFDSGSEVLGDSNWCGHPSHDSAHVFSFPLVGRISCALRPKAALDHRPPDCRSGLSIICGALCRGRLLENIFSSRDHLRFWNGGYCGSSNDGGDEFRGPGPRRHGLGN